MLGKQGDEFAVCRFSFGSGDGAAEDFLLHLEVAAVPCDLDRMAHCPLYAGRRRRKPFGDLRIQHLRYSGDGARTADRKKDPCTQVLKAFNMRRYAHLVEDVGDGAFQMCGRGSRHLRRGGQSGDGGGRSLFRLRVLPQALQKRSGVAGLGDKICRAEPCTLGNNGGVDKSGENDYRRLPCLSPEKAQPLSFVGDPDPGRRSAREVS